MSLSDFYCPECQNELNFKGKAARCQKCRREYLVKSGIYQLLPSTLSRNKIKEDEVYTLGEQDNAWYNNRIWYYFIHLSSHIVRFEKDFLPKIKGPRVLELACGNGWASMLVKRAHPKFQVFSSDISFNSINIQGNQMSQIMQTRPDYFVVCDAEKLPFRDNFFDSVFVVASLHHFNDIGTSLREAKRVLKPGGYLVAIDGMMPKIAQKVLQDDEPDRTKRFGILERSLTYGQWQNFLKEAGIPLSSLHLNYNTSHLHTYATNPDEKKLIKQNWLFNIVKEIIYGAILSKLNQRLIINLKLTSLFPAGIVIEYHKKKR